MKRWNYLKIIQIVLLVLIVITSLVFIRILYKGKELKNLASKETMVTLPDNIKNDVPVVAEDIKPEGEVTETEGDVSWDEENVEDTKVDEKEEEKKDNSEKGTYYIKVNYTANCVTVYKKDDSGNFTIPVKALICSTGSATPRSGVYKTSSKYRWHQLNGGVFGQYCTRITGHILFHSVPCSSNTPDSLKYGAYDKLGTTASSGCVRLTVEGAMWIYSNCPSGTYVEFYSSSNPGPLGKPSAKKISSNVACRNWDPTDPDPRNPWHNYVEPVETVKQEEKIVTPEPKPQEEPIVIPANNPEPNQQEPSEVEKPTEQKDNENQTNTTVDENNTMNTNNIDNTNNTTNDTAQNNTQNENTTESNTDINDNTLNP